MNGPVTTGLSDLFLDDREGGVERFDSFLLRLMRLVELQFLGGGCSEYC